MNNNFDILRLVFATTVFLVHMTNITTYFRHVTSFLDSSLAVQGFFIISGFLIFKSFENSSSSIIYFIKRIKRLYPAYFTVIFLCSLFGFLFSSMSFNQYFSAPQLYKYILSNLVFLNFIQPSLPGVFNNTPINGALWTIKIEVLFYISVPLIMYIFKKINKVAVIVSIYILSEIYLTVFNNMGSPKMATQLPGQMVYFISGAAFYYYFEWFKKKLNFLMVISVLIFCTLPYTHLTFLQPITLATIVMFISFNVPNIYSSSKYGDFSYGLYVFHFPILKAVTSLGIFNYNQYYGLIISILLVAATSFLSWNFIENPFLHKKKKNDTSSYILNPSKI